MSDEVPKGATATPAALTSYAVMTWVPGAFLVGLVEPTAMLLGAVVGFAAFIPLVVTGVTNLRLGDLPGGNTFLYFSSFFALGSGLTWLAQYFAAIKGWEYDIRILGWEWLVLATVLSMTTPAFKRPRTILVSIVALDVALYIIALDFLGVVNSPVRIAGGVLCFIAGTFAFYTAAAIILRSVGIKIPMGA